MKTTVTVSKDAIHVLERFEESPAGMPHSFPARVLLGPMSPAQAWALAEELVEAAEWVEEVLSGAVDGPVDTGPVEMDDCPDCGEPAGEGAACDRCKPGGRWCESCSSHHIEPVTPMHKDNLGCKA